MEIWKDVEDCDGQFSVSNLGGFRRNYCFTKLGKIRKLSGTIKPQKTKRGYMRVRFLRNGKKVATNIHRLMAIAFIPNPDNLPIVRHLNDIKDDNRLENLAWGTDKDNADDAVKNGRRKLAKPKEPLKGKPKNIINLETGELSTRSDVSVKLGINPNYLTRMLNGERPNNTSYRYLGSENLAKQPTRGVEKKNPIAVFDMSWNLISKFDYISEAVSFTKANRDDINCFINGKCGMCKGYKFKKIDENGDFIEPKLFIPKKPVWKGRMKGTKLSETAIDNIKKRWVDKKNSSEYIYPDGKEVIQLSMDDNEICRFKSISEALRYLNSTDKSGLRKLLNNRMGKSFKGYKWKYA